MPEFLEFHFQITNLGNDAFADDRRNGEVARLLRQTADALDEHGTGAGTLRDINGNAVGDFGYRTEGNAPMTSTDRLETVLTWESAGTDEPGDQNADSATRIGSNATSAYYSLGPAFAQPSADGERWSVELIQIRHAEEVGSTDLGIHPTEDAAKERAARYEHDGI